MTANLTDSELIYLHKRAGRVKELSAVSLDRLKHIYNTSMNLVWSTEGNIGPSEIFEQLGVNGGSLFGQANDLLQLILSYDPEWNHSKPTHEYTINEDGSVTIGDRIEPDEIVE